MDIPRCVGGADNFRRANAARDLRRHLSDWHALGTGRGSVFQRRTTGTWTVEVTRRSIRDLLRAAIPQDRTDSQGCEEQNNQVGESDRAHRSDRLLRAASFGEEWQCKVVGEHQQDDGDDHGFTEDDEAFDDRGSVQ